MTKHALPASENRSKLEICGFFCVLFSSLFQVNYPTMYILQF